MTGAPEGTRPLRSAREDAGSRARAERSASGFAQHGDRAAVVYDRDCGFCLWSLARVLDLDRRLRLRPVALQDPEADALLQGMEAERRYDSAHLVTADGKVYSGGAAAAPLLDLLPVGTPLSHAARLLTGALSLGYGLVARNRGLLGRPLSAQAKARALEQIDRHGADIGPAETCGL